MARGGKREGAGRRSGAATKRTREIADRAATGGITPLEVMLKAMRVHVDAERWDDTASIAKDAAPYVHPKLASVEMSGPGGDPIPVSLIRRVIVRPKRDPGDSNT